MTSYHCPFKKNMASDKLSAMASDGGAACYKPLLASTVDKKPKKR